MTDRRRIILLLDGTWNEDAAHDQDTNVVRLRDAVSRGITSEHHVPRSIETVNKYDSHLVEIGACPHQGCDYFIFYERGVGTGPGLNRLSGGALGYGVHQNIRRAYRFLSRYYLPGSEIFAFGFSRGAYTARSVVGLLSSAGLLKAEHCTAELEKEAWDYYSTSPNDRLPGVKRWLDAYVHPAGELRVACLGVFDTVGALGIPLSSFWRANRQRYEFHDVLLSPIVKLNLHALAIDEKRFQFEAGVWRQSKFRVSNSVTEQVWFPGEHSDVGGGLFGDEERKSGPRRLDDVTLDWMLKRVLHHYPDFPVSAHVSLDGPSDREPIQHDSRIWKYKLTPSVIRAIGNQPFPNLLLYESLVSNNRNESVVGESIHISALERLGTNILVVKNGMRQKLLSALGRIRRRGLVFSSGNARFYLPRNLIEHLPNLWARYCATPERDWGLKFVTVTNWRGDPLRSQSTYSSEELEQYSKDLEQVQKALNEAYERLENLGYDLRAPNWSFHAATRSLAAGKPAPKWLRALQLREPDQSRCATLR